MANAIVTLLLVAVMLTGVVMMAQSSFVSMDLLADAWKQMEVRSGDITRTELAVTGASHTGGSALVDITLKNTGQSALLDFESWDVVVQYYQSGGTYNQRWLAYDTASDPPNNRWTVKGIYKDAGASTPEVFQPKIFDPGEWLVVRMRLSPQPTNPQEHQAIIGTPNGVTVSTMF